MPNIKSAKKRMVLSRSARERNRAARSRLRTALRSVRDADSLEVAEQRRRAAVALLDRASTKNLVHKNKAARLVSQLDRLVRSHQS